MTLLQMGVAMAGAALALHYAWPTLRRLRARLAGTPKEDAAPRITHVQVSREVSVTYVNGKLSTVEDDGISVTAPPRTHSHSTAAGK